MSRVDMIAVLKEAEALLPQLLLSLDGWQGFFADTVSPSLTRVYRQWGENRIYLHRFGSCTDEDSFAHPHPWYSAMRILEGRYRMGIDDIHGKTLCTVEMTPGSCYEMTCREAWHWVRPLTDQCLTVMVATPVVWTENQIKSQQPVRMLSESEIAEFLELYRKHYPVRSENAGS